MESLQRIQARVRAVANVGKITKAMEVVAATKMRKAQEVGLASRPYAFRALELLEVLARNASYETELTTARPVAHTLVIIVASDRGLTGSFNTQVFRAADAFFTSDAGGEDSAHAYSVLGIGKKAMRYAEKRGVPLSGHFLGAGDFVNVEEVLPIAKLAIGGFREKKWDRVVAISTHFRTALKQETLVRQILPVDFRKVRETVDEIVPEHGRYAGRMGNGGGHATAEELKTEYIFEPSPKEAVEYLIPHLITMQLYHLVLEANASEHSARRVAMRTASDNADELSGELTLAYNKARQAGITKELTEIVGTQSASE